MERPVGMMFDAVPSSPVREARLENGQNPTKLLGSETVIVAPERQSRSTTTGRRGHVPMGRGPDSEVWSLRLRC